MFVLFISLLVIQNPATRVDRLVVFVFGFDFVVFKDHLLELVVLECHNKLHCSFL